jgi:hypothetical protein
MLKKAVSKVAVDESTGGVAFSPARPEQLRSSIPMGYVKDAFEARTKLADFWGILLSSAAVKARVPPFLQ